MVALAIAGFFIFYRRKQRQRADGDDRKGEDDGIDDNKGGFAVNAKEYEGSAMPPVVRAKAAYDAAKMAAPASSTSPKGNVAMGANDGGGWDEEGDNEKRKRKEILRPSGTMVVAMQRITPRRLGSASHGGRVHKMHCGHQRSNNINKNRGTIVRIYCPWAFYEAIL